MTEKEIELLNMFRNLDRHEQNIVIGKISELVLNKKKENINFNWDSKIKYYPVVFVFVL